MSSWTSWPPRSPSPVDIGERLVDVAVSIGAATPDIVGTTALSSLQRTADTAMYAGKHTGRPVLADRSHTAVLSVNGRRAGRPGTASRGVAL